MKHRVWVITLLEIPGNVSGNLAAVGDKNLDLLDQNLNNNLELNSYTCIKQQHFVPVGMPKTRPHAHRYNTHSNLSWWTMHVMWVCLYNALVL